MCPRNSSTPSSSEDLPPPAGFACYLLHSHSYVGSFLDMKPEENLAPNVRCFRRRTRLHVAEDNRSKLLPGVSGTDDCNPTLQPSVYQCRLESAGYLKFAVGACDWSSKDESLRVSLTSESSSSLKFISRSLLKVRAPLRVPLRPDGTKFRPPHTLLLQHVSTKAPR
jgi:hypothetical protein